MAERLQYLRPVRDPFPCEALSPDTTPATLTLSPELFPQGSVGAQLFQDFGKRKRAAALVERPLASIFLPDHFITQRILQSGVTIAEALSMSEDAISARIVPQTGFVLDTLQYYRNALITSPSMYMLAGAFGLRSIPVPRDQDEEVIEQAVREIRDLIEPSIRANASPTAPRRTAKQIAQTQEAFDTFAKVYGLYDGVPHTIASVAQACNLEQNEVIKQVERAQRFFRHQEIRVHLYQRIGTLLSIDFLSEGIIS